MVKSQNVIFQKSQKLLRTPTKDPYSKHSIAIHSLSMEFTLCVFVCGELQAREARNVCDFEEEKNSCNIKLYSFFTQANLFVCFEMCLKRITVANLCPNMLHFGF